MLNKNSYNTNSYTVEVLYQFYLNGRINLNLDVQRGYLWTSGKQQNLWDTLLTGFRIPEIHAIVNGNTYDIIDGKQRLTTIFNILGDKIPVRKNSIHSDLLQDLSFPKGVSELKFSELPQKYQDRVNFTKISIAEYNNLSADSEDYSILFRKINCGEPLSEIAQGISKNVHIRTHFTNLILNHPVFENFKLVNTEKNAEELELAIIRYMSLCKYGVNKSLDTSDIPYEEFTVRELSDYCARLNSLLDRIKDLSPMQRNRSKRTGLPHLLWDIDRFNLSEEEISKYVSLFSIKYTSQLNHIRNFTSERIVFFKGFSEKLLNEMRSA